jgi:hypothetical protein
MFKPFYADTRAFYINSKSFYVKSQPFDTKAQSFYQNAQLFKGTYCIPYSIVAFPRPLPLGLHLGHFMTPFFSCCYALSHMLLHCDLCHTNHIFHTFTVSFSYHAESEVEVCLQSSLHAFYGCLLLWIQRV